MNRRHLAVLALAVLAAGCTSTSVGSSGGAGAGPEGTHTLTRTATRVNTTFQGQNGDGQQETNQPVPYTKVVTIHAGGFSYISAQNQGGTGSETCTISVDGVQKESNTSSGGYTICTASGTV